MWLMTPSGCLAQGRTEVDVASCPDPPWCWNIFLQNWVMYGVNVGNIFHTWSIWADKNWESSQQKMEMHENARSSNMCRPNQDGF